MIELETVTADERVAEQRRRLAIGAALLGLARAAGRAPMAYSDGRGDGPIAEVVANPNGTPRAVLIALPHAELERDLHRASPAGPL